jgi:uncharacterized membrane protein
MPLRSAVLIIAPSVLAACMAPAAQEGGSRNGRSSALISDAYTPLPEAFEATIRSPRAWRARVAAKALVLEGPMPRRNLVIERSEVMFDGRNVVGRDALGTVEIRATPRLCQDGVDGAWLPYTVRITIEGTAPLLGCGIPINHSSSSSQP